MTKIDKVVQSYTKCKVLQRPRKYYKILQSTTQYYTVLHSTTNSYKVLKVLHNLTQYCHVL